MQILNVEHLTKDYPTFKLDDICFSMDQGSIVGLIGRNVPRYEQKTLPIT